MADLGVGVGGLEGCQGSCLQQREFKKWESLKAKVYEDGKLETL